MRVLRSTRNSSKLHAKKKPEVPDRPDLPLFKAPASLRKIRVLLDMDSPELRVPNEQADLLLGLLDHESILGLRFSEAGAPTGVERVTDYGLDVPMDWLEVLPAKGSIQYAEGDSIATAALHMGNFGEVARKDVGSGAFEDLSDQDAAARREADVQLLVAAESINVDLLITTRGYLHADSLGLIGRRPVEVLSPSDALPVVGLYLRTQGEYVVSTHRQHGFTYNFNRGLMYWVASRSLLPEGWRWMSACVQHGLETKDDLLVHYAGTAHSRMERALRSRDALFLALNQPQNNDTADDALIAFDNILISLSSAMDVVARVLNYVLGKPKPPHAVSWRNKDWIKSVRMKVPGAADLVKDDAYGHLLTIVGGLRNTVHGASLQPLAVAGMGRRDDTLVGLPSEQLDAMLAAMDATGGRDSWGVRQLIPGQAHANLDVVCERLMSMVPEFMNRAMALTPIEDLAHAALGPADFLPSEEMDSPFRESSRRYILWQLGLKIPE